ncbi:thymidylate synthase, partial [bacterium]|nr:thymidylate synthase [bacterium]
HVIILGMKTHLSIGKALPGRVNIILTTNKQLNIKQNEEKINQTDKPINDNPIDSLIDDKPIINDNTPVHYVDSPIAAIMLAERLYKDKHIFVVGGESVYKYFLENKLVDRELISQINNDMNCDKFYFSSLKPKPFITLSNGTMVYEALHENKEELNFLHLMRELIDNGRQSTDRTLVGTRSLFGRQLRFTLANGTFPLLTTRKMFLRGIFEELMFYLRGQTDAKLLAKKGVAVWLPNTTRQELDKKNLQHMPEGDMGHSYGFSFRHFGGDYKTCDDDYNGVGFDQLNWLINEIKTNPNSRRLVISLWEPNKMHNAVMPPCLYQYQFYVRDQQISCMMTQRSSDYFTAGGWNVATGALLTYLIGAVCDLQPYELIWNMGDVHLYNNLVAQAKQQIIRKPFVWPKLAVVKKADITSYEFSDIALYHYQYYNSIKPIMNV